MKYRIGVDTGGTFTDVALIAEGTGDILVTKVPSTPHNSAIGVMDGVKQILSENEISADDVSFFTHGSTVATNTLLESKGAKTALITTRGFRDILEIGRQTRPDLYNFRARRPEPLIPRNLRWEIDERIDARGEIVKDFDREDIDELIDMVKEHEIESLVICLINSFLNSDNEVKLKEMLKEEFPDLSITISAEILPEIKEYERTSTVAVNGYVMPKMNFYLRDLENSLQDYGIKSDLYIMQSNGGIITTDTAVEQPVRTVLSGPAGGVISGTDVSSQTGIGNLITIDMGGTSLDAALIETGEPQYTTNSRINDFPINVPMVEMHTIGSGGGSIAWIDSGGALRVGPHSAGADPGPVCYDRGGTEPTVSDANAILGRLNPDSILGGKMKMNLEGARKAVKEKIAEPLGLSVEEAAEGILKVVNANMVRGIRVISVEKGHDTRDFSLLAFGGAGPLHAVDIAQELESKNVIVPPSPGINCATGMLIADVRHDYVSSFISTTTNTDYDKLNQSLKVLEDEARAALKRQGFDEDHTQINHSIDLRYVGQAYDINVALGSAEVDAETLKNAIRDFHDIHEKIYGFSRREESLETVNVRVSSFGLIEKLESKRLGEGSGAEVTHTTRDVYFDGEFHEAKIYQRSDLYMGYEFEGPAIIEQLDSTAVIRPGQNVRVDTFGNLIIENTDTAHKEDDMDG
ncbi:hydantoinase/oxoprolinase family protein [Salinicoccus halitifaciens]|uniref:N-methylhydantoinase A n=1 Tax=Salinicoccus halitifaciens TaxID=1073415 RepID=A0ABV2ECC4_9STAP|nr:hydantoinase/oxoprolinase family protein [Salinicoccus halitifaciens]MCD2138555.1 hydantoinase/oxoprolinase family protein [Salinicoccus halitifaciens]